MKSRHIKFCKQNTAIPLGTQVSGRSFPSPFQPAKKEKHTRRARDWPWIKRSKKIMSQVREGRGGGGRGRGTSKE